MDLIGCNMKALIRSGGYRYTDMYLKRSLIGFSWIQLLPLCMTLHLCPEPWRLVNRALMSPLSSRPPPPLIPDPSLGDNWDKICPPDRKSCLERWTFLLVSAGLLVWIALFLTCHVFSNMQCSNWWKLSEEDGGSCSADRAEENWGTELQLLTSKHPLQRFQKHFEFYVNKDSFWKIKSGVISIRMWYMHLSSLRNSVRLHITLLSELYSESHESVNACGMILMSLAVIRSIYRASVVWTCLLFMTCWYLRLCFVTAQIRHYFHFAELNNDFKTSESNLSLSCCLIKSFFCLRCNLHQATIKLPSLDIVFLSSRRDKALSPCLTLSLYLRYLTAAGTFLQEHRCQMNRLQGNTRERHKMNRVIHFSTCLFSHCAVPLLS